MDESLLASFIHLCAGGGYWVTLDTRLPVLGGSLFLK
jgi:hypothetical protein